MSWADQMISEYRKSSKRLNKYKRFLDRIDSKELTDQQAYDLEKVNEMVSGMAYAIDWLRTGHQPGAYRGIDRRGIYQNPQAIWDDYFQPIQDPVVERERYYSSEDRKKALELIEKLSKRERDCYLLHVAYGLSVLEIAKKMKIKKSTAQSYIERAQKKIPVGQA